MRQLAVGELGLAQGEAYSVQRVVGEAAGLGERGAGRGERVPGTRRRVGLLVLHGVQEMREPAEEAPCLGEGRCVGGPSGQDRGVRERGGGGGLGRFGDGQDRCSGPGQGLDAELPLHRVHEYGGVEPDVGAGPRPGPPPAPGDPACGERHRPAGQQPVPVGDMVTHLRRGEHQRDGRREPRPLALRDGRGPHPAQRAGPGRTPPSSARPLDLSLRQHREDQAVVVGDNSRELTVISAQCETQPAQMRHPLRLETLTEPM